MNIYRTYYKSDVVDFTANSQYEAQTIAAKHFKAKEPWDVAVVLLVVGDIMTKNINRWWP